MKKSPLKNFEIGTLPPNLGLGSNPLGIQENSPLAIAVGNAGYQHRGQLSLGLERRRWVIYSGDNSVLGILPDTNRQAAIVELLQGSIDNLVGDLTKVTERLNVRYRLSRKESITSMAIGIGAMVIPPAAVEISYQIAHHYGLAMPPVSERVSLEALAGFVGVIFVGLPLGLWIGDVVGRRERYEQDLRVAQGLANTYLPREEVIGRLARFSAAPEVATTPPEGLFRLSPSF